MSEWCIVSVSYAGISPSEGEEKKLILEGPDCTNRITVILGSKKITVDRADLAGAIRRLS